jgi:hypothetical protein
MNSRESDRRGSAGGAFAFVADAFRLERLRHDIDALFRWLSGLPKDLDPSTERAVLGLARTACTQAVREFRRSHGALSGQVSAIALYMEEAGLGTGRVAEAAWRAPPAEQSLFAPAQSARRAPVSDRTADLVRLDLERAFESQVESNVESNLGEGASSGKPDGGERK